VRTELDSEGQDNGKETGAIESSLCLDCGPDLIPSIVFQGPKNDNKHVVIDRLKELKNCINKLVNRNLKQSKVKFIVMN